VRLIAKIAWRNLGRNRRRSVITVLAVAFAALFAIAMRGVQLGTYEENISFALRLFPGSAQVQAPGFLENPTLHRSFIPDGRTVRAIREAGGVEGYAPRVIADGLVSYRGNSLGAALFGIDPARERGVTTIASRVSAGDFLRSDSSDDVVVGYKLLENLKAAVGDRIVILSQGYDGTTGNRRFTIAGTVKTGSGEFDRMAVFLGLRTLQDLLGMGGRVQVIALSIRDVDRAGEAAAALNASLDTARTVAIPWQKVVPDLEQSIDLDNISGMVFLGILIVVVAFGILNTVLMSVTERFREFGVLLALGMPQGKLAWVVFLETMMITLAGLAIGNVLAFGVNWYLMVHPVEFGGDYAAMMEEYGFLPLMRSSLRAGSFFNTTVAVLAISVLSTVYPLYRTYRLEPLKGIRYT
jgi:ABC-type lipoprotein release transport system permease subunit